MQVGNMGDHVTTVCPEKLMTTPGRGSSTTQHHIEIPIEELASLEAARYKRRIIDANDNVMKPEEQGEHTEVKGECRYCQEEDLVSKLEAPCSCNGSLKYAHRSCIERWCNIRGSIICEICKQFYYPNYSVTELLSDDDIDMSEGPTIPRTNTLIHTPLLLAERGINRVLASMNEDFTLRNPSGGVIFGTTLLVLLALLVIRDAYHYAPPKEDKFSHTLYCVLVIISVPVYILSWVFECQAHRERNRERENERDRNA